ncbi:MAG: triose-phosphate isomerase [Bacteroidota bacterium]|nr:triose-phosphate isomerase [Bacteroidota bacterium]
MRNKLIAGNWKMFTNLQQGVELATDIANGSWSNNVEVIICPPLTHLAEVKKAVNSKIHIGAQNIYQEIEGAYTGEVSAGMVVSAGADYVLVGHSERRQYFNENPELLLAKVKAALAVSLKVIYCLGESLEQRESDEYKNVITSQIQDIFNQINGSELNGISIAYEPIWAIGTGKTASPEQAQEAHAIIRNELANIFNQGEADKVRILYGGSMKANNAEELLSQPDIDGGLIGGASLKAVDFLEIIAIASK